MPVLEVSQLDKAGVITDVNEYLLAPEAFSEGYNVKFGNGSVEAAKGYIEYKMPDIMGGVELLQVKGIADKMYFFSESRLFVMRGTDILSVDYPSVFGNISEEFYINPLSNLPVVINNRTPYGIIDKTGNKTEIFKLDGWGNNMTCKSVVAYKGYLFAFGVTISNQLFEDTVFWSDVAAPDTYPKDWGFNLDGEGNLNLASPIKGSQGGYNQLNSIGGSIIAAHEFGDHLYLFTESEIWRVSFVGGDFIFQFQKVLTGKGCISPEAVLALENGLVVIGSNSIYLFNGQSSQPISDSRINNLLSDKLLSGVRVKLIKDLNEKQLLIFLGKRMNVANQNPTKTWDDDNDWVDTNEWQELDDPKLRMMYPEAIVWDWVSNTFSLRDGNYCMFKDISEYRADSLFDDTNKQWKDPSIAELPWNDIANQTSWHSQIKYGTGVITIRSNQILILHRDYDVISPTGARDGVSWSLKRRFHNNVFGYEERAIVRIHNIKVRGIENNTFRASINGTMGNKKSDTFFFRETAKQFEVTIFGKGQSSLPAYSIQHSLIGMR